MFCVTVLGGCGHLAGQPTNSFSWYHPQGGEYLFAYDHNQCDALLASRGQRKGTAIDGPFFNCMRDRGYQLLDAQGELLIVDITRNPATQSVTQQ